jgi:hypothetical protein
LGALVSSCVVLAVCAALAGVAGASTRSVTSHVTPAESAAVHAYLIDQYEYVEAASEVAPTVVASFEARAQGIAKECPGALAGAQQGAAIEAAMRSKRRSARERGEERRREIQLGDLHDEIDMSLTAAEQQPLGGARATLLAKLKTLPTVAPLLAALVEANVSNLEESLGQEAPDACADIHAWVASGYRSLSPASRAIALGREAKDAADLRDTLKQLSGLESDPLTSLESPADRALESRTTQTESRIGLTIANSLLVALQHMEVALGLQTHELSKPKESKSTTRLGSGRTAAGTRYMVSLERTKGGGHGCKAQVQIRPPESGMSGAFGQILLTIGSEPVLCLSGSGSAAPLVQCSEGLIEVRARLLPAARTVVLRLSDGRQVVSRAVLIPARLGGPAAIYYQALRGPSPIPVSLIERDAQGHTLRVVNLQRIVGCSKHPLKYLSGGRRTLVHAQTQGPKFSIVGERYRLFGRVHSQLKLRTGEGPTSFEEYEEEGLDEAQGEPTGSFRAPVRHLRPLESEVSTGCHPHEYSIFYGLLKPQRDTVLAKVAGKLVPLLRVRIPASLHAGGVLVYLASESQPEEVVVRSPSGKVVMSEDLSRAASEGRETCEGESEGPGPPPGGGFGETGETSRIVLNG